MDYRATLSKDDNGTILVTFPDFPEAQTFGDTRAEALAHGVNALATVMDAYMKDRRPIPTPSKAKTKGPVYLVQVPPMMAAKVGIYQAMVAADMTKYALAKKLDWHAPQVDRLLSLTHRSDVDSLIMAANALGQRLNLSVRPLQHVTTTCPSCGNETTLSFTAGETSTERWVCPQCDAMHSVTVKGSGVVATASVSRAAR